jgi:PhnB protein
MTKFTSLEGHLYVNNIKEAFAFYGKALGMVAVPYHGYDILTLDGKHFFHIFEAAPTAQGIPMPSSQFHQVLLKACVEVTTADEVKAATEALAADGGKINDPPRPLPWSPCAADVVDKYGIEWFISTPMFAPPEGCLACVPIGEKPGCDLCIRWDEEGYVCPKI